MKATAKQVKEVTIIARYQFKADPRKVCYLVRSSNGKDVYFACLFNGKATSCQCPSRKPCKHMRLAEEREAQRIQIATRAASETDLARIEAETLAQIEQEQAAPVAPKSEQARIADLDESDEDVKLEEWTRQELSLADEANYPLDAAEKTIKRMEANMTPEEKAERDAARAARRERAMESAPLNGSRAFSLLRR